MKYLSLDIGQKNIGVAVGELLAGELTTIRANKDEDFHNEAGRARAISEINKLLIQEQADAVVIGLPVDEEGGMTNEAKRIKEFGEALKESLDKKIHYVNETLTSFMAEDLLEEQGLDPEQIKERVDQHAALLILQQYLESDEGL